MAEDLNPVPADASADLTRRQPAAPEPDTEAGDLLVTRPPQPRDREPHLNRFRIAYAMLAIVLGAAVGGFIVLAGRGDESAMRGDWSSWQPEGSDFGKTQQIASFVGRRYRLPSGKELVAVIPRVPPAIQTSTQAVPISNIVFAESTNPDDISVYPSGNSVEYTLCGVGSPSGRCAIGEGKATVERARLLHRESLELALFTFKYVDGVDSVVTLQPPRAGSNPTFALFFRKDDFKDSLDRPLSQTLQGKGPFSTQDFPQVQQTQVSRLVDQHLFRFSYQQAPDGSALMVLEPPAV